MNLKPGQYFHTLIISLCLLWVFPAVALAQDCDYFKLDNKSKLKLDEGELCNAAQALIDEGYEVMVLVADKGYMSQDDWYAYLDGWESKTRLHNNQPARTYEGIYNSVLIVEVNFNEEVTITYGDMFKERISNAKLTSIKDRILAKMSEDPTADGVMVALAYGFEKLYDLQVVATPPVVVQKEPEVQPVRNTDNDLSIGFIVIGGVLFFFLAFMLFKYWQKRKAFKDYLAYIDGLGGYAIRYMNACNEALKGSRPEKTDIYQLWKLYNGEYNVAKDKHVLRLIDECKDALDQCYSLYERLQENEKPRNMEEAKAAGENWELLYVTVLGKSTEVSLNPDKDHSDLFSSFSVPDNVVEDSPLIQQINSVYHDLRLSDEYNTEVMAQGKNYVDELGVVGRIMQIKRLILDQQKAFEAYPGQKKKPEHSSPPSEAN